MSQPYATVQAGSGIIGDAAGTTVIIDADASDQFGEGATLIVWPSGQNLDPNIRNYETMTIESKSGTTLNVSRGTEADPTGLGTFAEGDQLALSFPTVPRLPHTQTQVLKVGLTSSSPPFPQGPTIDLGADALGIVGKATATIKDVNLDGAASFPFLSVGVICSFDDVNWDSSVTVASGIYSNYQPTFGGFTADDPTPIYSLFSSARYLRFVCGWYASDLGAAASATITFVLEYF